MYLSRGVVPSSLDYRTLFLSSGIAFSALLLFLLIQIKQTRRPYPGFVRVVVGIDLLTAAIVVADLRGYISDALWTVQIASLCAFALFDSGIRLFCGAPRRGYWPLMYTVAAMLFQTFLFLTQTLHVRIIGNSLLLIPIFIDAALPLMRDRSAGSRFPYRFTAAALIFGCVTSFIRIAAVLSLRVEASPYFSATPTNTAFFAMLMFLTLSLGFGIIALTHGRLTAESIAHEEQLQNLTERLTLATRTASIGIWDLDLRSDHLVWDKTMFEIFGISSVVPLSRENGRRLVHPEDLPLIEAASQRVVLLKTQESVEYRLVRPDGSVRYISSTEGPILDKHGNVVRLVGTAVDITERKEMELQIEASARLSALGMMAGGVAHEINNPLAIILSAAADLLRRLRTHGSVPSHITQRNGERIVETSKRIAKTIKSMRQLAREGSQDQLRPTPARKIVEETLEVCRERFKYHGVNLVLSNIDPALSVYCREVQIGQVLLNLLQNAFDSVTEQAGERWVTLATLVREDAVEFSVADSGSGIPPELKTKIMDPFFTTKEVGKGSGLGLSISRSIVKEHGGELDLREQNGHPCFFFCLRRSRNKEHCAA